MEKTRHLIKLSEVDHHHHRHLNNDDDESQLELLIKPLQKQMFPNGTVMMYLYSGSWCPAICLKPILRFQKHFKSHDTDIIVSTLPKSGTTWLKALTFAIVNRSDHSIDEHHPLLTSNPHTLVPFLDVELYNDHEIPNLESIPNPRIFGTHLPYNSFPNSIKDSKCKNIYICRDPKDQFISYWQFRLKNGAAAAAATGDVLSMEEEFEMFCKGIIGFGPFWKHVLEFWNAHVEDPDKVLFLKYEDLKRDILSNVKMIGEFVGLPFSLEEEKQGLVEKISELCSFNSLKNLEVNKSGTMVFGLEKSSLFRKGETGDWANHLTPEMAERIDKITEIEFRGSGLTFTKK